MTDEHYSVLSSDGVRTEPYQVPLFSSAQEAEMYHRTDSGGYFSLLTNVDGRKRQDSYPTVKMPVVLGLVDANRDTWISQAEFWSSLRRVVNVKSVGLAFLDLDFYKEDVAWGCGRTPEVAARDFVGLCDDFDIPRPSLIVFSGRGLQVKWLFESALPRMALPRWSAVESRLVEVFTEYGADPQAKDAARVLRLVQTVNTKSKLVCRVVWINGGDENNPVRYDFEYFAECVLPFSRKVLTKQPRKALEAAKTTRSEPSRQLSLNTLNWSRVEDLRALVKLRGGIEEGQRMLMLFYTLNFLALSHQVTSATFYYEAAAIAKEIDPTWTANSAELRTVYAKMQDYLACKTVEFHGRTYPALYTPSNDTLINVFKITDDEQRKLKTIIDRSERHRRQIAAARSAGVISRFEYEDRAEQREIQARLLSAKGLSIRKIAEELAISKSQVQRYLAGCPKYPL